MSSMEREIVFKLANKRMNVEDDRFDPTPYCGILATNAMTWGHGDDAVICPKMARANHSCRPNAEFVSRLDLDEQHLVTIYPIAEGEEITINYMDMDEEGTETTKARQSYLRNSYKFQCSCEACETQVGQREKLCEK